VGVKWTTGFGELVSSTAYFDRKVIETEDETDFIWTALLPLVTVAAPNLSLPGPIASAITEEKNYQRFVQEVRFASQLSGPLQFVAGVFYSDLHGALPFAGNYLSALAPGYGAALTAANTCGTIGSVRIRTIRMRFSGSNIARTSKSRRSSVKFPMNSRRR